MKSIRLITIVWMVGSLLCACTSEEEQLPFSDSESVSFIVKEFEGEAENRTALTMEENYAIFTWAEKDTVGIYPDKGDQVSFSMGAGAGSNSATFDGGAWNLKSSHTYYAYYPFDRGNYSSQDSKKNIPVSYKGQTQVGNNNTSHIGKYAYMTAVGTSPVNGSLTFNFSHLSTLLVINATMEEATTLVSVTVDAGADTFAVEGTYNLMSATPSITPKESVQSLKLELQDVSLTDDNLNFVGYMMIPPGPKTITVTLEDDKGGKYYCVLEKKFNAGSYYRANLVNTTDAGSYSNGVATLKEAGTLAAVLGDQMLTLTSLKIVGEINGTDVKNLRQMLAALEYDDADCGELTTLDLSGATVVEGGDAYYLSYKTVNNEIGEQMFKNCPNLQSMRMPENTTSIGENAFYGCGVLTSINMPSKTSWISYGAFTGCNKLSDCYITDLAAWCEIYNPEGFTFPNLYLNGELITNLEIPEGVTTIRSRAFSGCCSLTSVTIPDNVTTIGDCAFERCSSLTSVTIPDSMTEVRFQTFSGCI